MPVPQIYMQQRTIVVDLWYHYLSSGYTSRKQGFCSGLASPLVPVVSRTGTHGAYVPVRAPRGPVGPRGALVPVRLDPYVLVPDKNPDQWVSWGIGPGSWQEP